MAALTNQSAAILHKSTCLKRTENVHRRKTGDTKMVVAVSIAVKKQLSCSLAIPEAVICLNQSDVKIQGQSVKKSSFSKFLSKAQKGRKKSTVYCAIAGKGGPGEALPGPEDGDLDAISSSQSFFHPAFASPSRERDWRSFRSQLVGMEQRAEKKAEENRGPEKPGIGKWRKDVNTWTVASGGRERRRWAHAIPEIEKGCILVATEQLNGYAFFEKSVILLLGHEGDDAPYGLVLNKPLSRNIGSVKGMDGDLMQVFGSCPVNIGGPLDTRRFLMLHGVQDVEGSDEILLGAYCGSMSAMEASLSAVNMQVARPEDFRFFFGYSGWDTKQLQKEIKLGWWHVAACSTDILLKDGHDKLWEEVLQLMGGKYAKSARTDMKES